MLEEVYEVYEESNEKCKERWKKQLWKTLNDDYIYLHGKINGLNTNLSKSYN